MAVADLAEYIAKCLSPWQKYNCQKNNASMASSRTYQSLWTVNPFAGATPSTAAALTMATAGSGDRLERFNPSASLYVAQARLGPAVNTSGCWILCDRLSHQGGLSGTVTGVVTTNLPTAALTRYTTGEGVWAAWEIYNTVGTTGTTFTCSYTNQAGTAGRTSLAQAFGATNNREANLIVPITLAAGDTGVRSVESTTIAASTLTAGNWGITLFKPLVMIPKLVQMGTDWDAMFGGGGNLAEIVDDACLFWLSTGHISTHGLMSGQLHFIEA